MDIVIIADFCGNFDHKDNIRFLYLAELLSDNHDVELITSDFNHGTKEYFVDIPKEKYQITMLHEKKYPRNVCLQRFIGHYVWGKNVKKYLDKRKRPDVIYCAVPTLTATQEAAKYCKKNKVRFIIDIQDLWPEAFKMAFNVPVISDFVFLPFKILENQIFRSADSICAVSKTYVDRVLEVNKKCIKGHPVYLGTVFDDFDKYTLLYKSVKYDDNMLNDDKKGLWLGYCGSLGDSYEIDTVIKALALLGNDAPLFIVMGKGEKKDYFEHLAEINGVKAVFTGALPYPQMCSLLSRCDIAINPIKGTSVASIINKHADYAAAGIPVINTQNSNEYCSLVNEYCMGFNCENGNEKDLAQKIKLIAVNPELQFEMGKNARKCGEEKFNRNNSYQELVRLIIQGE